MSLHMSWAGKLLFIVVGVSQSPGRTLMHWSCSCACYGRIAKQPACWTGLRSEGQLTLPGCVLSMLASQRLSGLNFGARLKSGALPTS